MRKLGGSAVLREFGRPKGLKRQRLHGDLGSIAGELRIRHPSTCSSDDITCCTPGSEQYVHCDELLRAARWIVHVSSTAPDGSENQRCSGIFIQWNKEEGRARILTSHGVAWFFNRGERLYNPVPKIEVRLRNERVVEVEARLLFFDEHYEFALLEISLSSSFEVELLSLGCSPRYGQKVFALARDKDFLFHNSHGTIVQEERDHFLFLDLDHSLPPCAPGGPVINHSGDLIGISSDCVVCSITTILTCIEMWDKYRRIARPMPGMCLSTVELLDIAQLEKLWRKYDIKNGFIAEQVTQYSTAEKLGIKQGDVIVSFNGISPCSLPQFEDFLLSIGLNFLRGVETVNEFKISCMVCA